MKLECCLFFCTHYVLSFTSLASQLHAPRLCLKDQRWGNGDMLTIVRMRICGRRLARSLRYSVSIQSEEWVIVADEAGRSQVEMGRFVITITPRWLRLFDATHVYFDGSEVWLPLVARLRLRNSLRLMLIKHALAHVPEVPDARRRWVERRDPASREHAA